MFRSVKQAPKKSFLGAFSLAIFVRSILSLMQKRGLDKSPYGCSMEMILTVISGITTAIAIFGGLIAAVFFAYAGILWMSANGDPQKVAQARMSLVGTFIGLVIVGVAFMVPGVISEMVIEPAGGVAVEAEYGTDCDRILQRQLVVQRTASDSARMQRLITHIQSTRDGCSSEIWHPIVQHLATTSEIAMCVDSASTVHRVGGLPIPVGLKESGVLRDGSSRDAANNIIVFFDAVAFVGTAQVQGLPSDGAVCWMYSSAFSTWASAPYT